MKRFIETAISIVLGAALLYVALSRFGLTQTLTTINRAHPQFLILGSVPMIASYFPGRSLANLGA
jgi:hypothetical protein